MEQAGIDEDDLIFLDDINFSDLVRSGRMSLTIVDHNELAPTQTCASDAIIGIVDRHTERGLYLNILGPAREINAKVVSTATMVTQVLLRSPAGRHMLTDPAVAVLLRSATFLGAPEKGSTPALDEKIQATSTEMCSDEDAFGMKADEWKKKLNAAHLDIANLTLHDIMRTEMWQGISGPTYFLVTSLPSLEDLGLKQKEEVIGFIVDMSNFASSEGLCWLWVLAEGVDGNRQLIVLTAASNFIPVEEKLQEAIEGKGSIGGKAAVWPIESVDGNGTSYGTISVGEYTATIYDVPKHVTNHVLFYFVEDFHGRPENAEAAGTCPLPGNCGEIVIPTPSWDEGHGNSSDGSLAAAAHAAEKAPLTPATGSNSDAE
jgi:hypothetical protein